MDRKARFTLRRVKRRPKLGRWRIRTNRLFNRQIEPDGLADRGQIAQSAAGRGYQLAYRLPRSRECRPMVHIETFTLFVLSPGAENSLDARHDCISRKIASAADLTQHSRCRPCSLKFACACDSATQAWRPAASPLASLWLKTPISAWRLRRQPHPLNRVGREHGLDQIETHALTALPATIENCLEIVVQTLLSALRRRALFFSC